MKRVLIIKEQDSKVLVYNKYIHVKNFEQEFIIGFIHIKALYINKSIKLDIGECYKISQKVPLYLIDHNGYILSQLVDVSDA